jgi:hypothetical protein
MSVCLFRAFGLVNECFASSSSACLSLHSLFYGSFSLTPIPTRKALSHVDIPGALPCQVGIPDRQRSSRTRWVSAAGPAACGVWRGASS